AWLEQFLFRGLKKLVADDKLRMAARVGALVMIGDLNDREPEVKDLKLVNPLVPLAAATPYLLQLFEDPQTPPALRMAALRGLHRHAQFGLGNPVDVPAVQAAMRKAAQETNVTKE